MKISDSIKKVLLLVGLSPLWGACSDFLVVEPQNIITIEQFWNEEQDITNSIAGCYSAMQSYGMISRMMIWGEFRSENVINRGIIEKDAHLERLLKENITSNNVYCAWNEFYNIINRCNIIIYFAPKVQESDPAYTKSELNAHIAEATAIRDLCYFYLIRTFRNVPYTVEPYLDDAQKMNMPPTDFATVLDNLIASLEEVKDNAIVYYPKTSTLSARYQTGRITQLAIYAMLCEMYLWKQDYEKCCEYADFVIKFKTKYIEDHNATIVDYTPFYGYPLMSCRSTATGMFGAAFNDLFVNNNSNESIFELAFVKNNDNMLCNGPVSNFYGAQNLTGWVQPSLSIQTAAKRDGKTLFADNDGRRYENFRFNSGGDVLGINKYTIQSQLSLTATASYGGANENWGAQYPTHGKDNESRNKSSYIIYRLSDIMLLKAEALCMQMQDSTTTLSEEDQALRDKAFELVDAVNLRSQYQSKEIPTSVLKKSDYSTKEKLKDLIYDERNRELMFEGKRWYDLVRCSLRENNTDYLRSKVKNKSTDLASIVDSFFSRIDAIFWPYHLDEIKANDELARYQNPAFGSGENSSISKN